MAKGLTSGLVFGGREVSLSAPFTTQTTMTKTQDRQARQAGLTVVKRRRGTVYSDPITGKSIYNGNRSRKSFRHERRLEAFLRDSGDT